MKKIGVLLIFLLLLNILALSLIQAQEINPETGLPKGLESLENPEELIETAKNKTQTSSEYLKQEWKKVLLENKYLGPVIRFSDKVLSPISKLLLKKEVDFSWVYFFTLIIWLTIIFLAYKPLKLGLNMSKNLSILSGIIIASLALRATPSTWFEFQVSLIWKAIIIGIILLVIAGDKVLMDYLESSVKKEIEKRRERKAKTIEKIHNITLKANK